ncbi:alpha/beta hydrolase [Microbacterium sp. zg-YB36]|uniref:alpha/beta fold hydrolase n=1 Tax=Microbacterium sp. zg-YB36 TaxID=2969407 RepID=UPI00214BA58C|nr:alpha/beta hydrolase [Microbacterium sp. zg-YB36]MDL5351842.1 alpha/beta hydrolase [Microbacterium sp. zg-YB36]
MSVDRADGEAQGIASRAAQFDAALGPIDWSLLPPDVQRDRVTAPSGALARISMGPVDGQRVVLVPGVTGSKEDFIRMMPMLAAAGYRVESFDMAGQYESYTAGPENLVPPQRRYTLELFVDDLLAVLATGATPAHVLGYSFAGTVVAATAVAHPELFSSITLLSAPPIAGQALRAFKILGPVSGPIPARTAARLMMWGVRNNVHRGPQDRAVFVRARFALTRTSSVEDIFWLMKHTPDLADALRALGLPILVVTGTGDVWPVAAHQAYAARLNAVLRVIDTGHSPCESAPHQLTEAMLVHFPR